MADRTALTGCASTPEIDGGRWTPRGRSDPTARAGRFGRGIGWAPRGGSDGAGGAFIYVFGMPMAILSTPLSQGLAFCACVPASSPCQNPNPNTAFACHLPVQICISFPSRQTNSSKEEGRKESAKKQKRNRKEKVKQKERNRRNERKNDADLSRSSISCPSTDPSTFSVSTVSSAFPICPSVTRRCENSVDRRFTVLDG